MKYITEFIQENPKLRNYKAMAWTPEDIKNFWDYESLHEHNYFAEHHKVGINKVFQKYLQGDIKVLDYGAGQGSLVASFLEKGIKCSTFDLSPESQKTVVEKFKGNSNYLGSITPDNAEENKGKFDVIFMMEVVEHLEDETREQVFKQVNSLLKDGGLFIMSTPNDEDLMKYIVYNPRSNELFHRQQHVYSWTGKSLVAAAKPFGFAEHDVFTVNFRYFNDGLKYLVKRAYRFMKPKKCETLIVILRKEAKAN